MLLVGNSIELVHLSVSIEGEFRSMLPKQEKNGIPKKIGESLIVARGR